MLSYIIFLRVIYISKFMKVCIGGTFNTLHKGHKSLINKAFKLAGSNGLVFIGITTGWVFSKKRNLKSLDKRKKTLEEYLSKEGFMDQVIIKPIKDKYGLSTEEEFDAIVVSPETQKTAEEINKIRRQKRKKTLKIIQIPMEFAKDGKPISSTRVNNKEIDENGNILHID